MAKLFGIGGGLSAASVSAQINAQVPGMITAQALTPVARTAAAGFAKQNGTPVILTWNTPNDGNMHPFVIAIVEVVTTLEAGGQVSAVFTAGGTAFGAAQAAIFNGSAAVGAHSTDTALGMFIADPNTTVNLQQTTALTSGASKVWAAILAV